MLSSGTLWVFTQNQQQLDDVATRLRFGQIMLSTSEKLSLGKLVLQSDLPDKGSTINQLLDDIFLTQAVVNTSLRFDNHPDDIASLRGIQLDLPTTSLLLQDLQIRLALGETLTQEDILRLAQLDSISEKITNAVKKYEQNLNEDTKRITQRTIFYRRILIGAMIAMIVAISLVIYYNVLRPINLLTEAAEEYGQGNYEHVIGISGQGELGQLGDAFDRMGNQISTLVHTQERTIADRTRALETSTEVSRRLSTILDEEQLVKEVVEQLVTAFDYYYAHIYLFEEDENTLVMKGGTGEAGTVLLSRGHTIPKGRGLVGRAAETNKVILVGDTLNEEGWLPNDLLPETRSECAVPISIGENVLGVFDVQHNIVDGITEEDVDLLESLANQVAIAVQNAQAYTIAQEQAEREVRISKISAQIQQATTIDDVMKIAISELGQTLNSKRTSVELNMK